MKLPERGSCRWEPREGNFRTTATLVEGRVDRFSDGSSTLPASTITDTPFDTIVSRGVSLFIRKKRSDYKSFVVTALHFMVSVAKIKGFLQEWIIQNLKI